MQLCPAWPVTLHPMQLLRSSRIEFRNLGSQTRPVSREGQGGCVFLVKGSLDIMNLDNILQICEGLLCLRVMQGTIHWESWSYSSCQICLACPELCPVTPIGRLRCLVFAGVI